MNRTALKTCAGLMAAALGLLGAPRAAAQTPPTAFPGDWPNLGAFNNRQNRNGDPATFTPGRADLRWVAPGTVATRNILTLDNTDLPATGTLTTANLPGGPYDPPYVVLNPTPSVRAGEVTWSPFNLAAWPSSSALSKEADSPYVLSRRSRTSPLGTIDRRDREPRYAFSTCIPAARASNDPTVPQPGSALKWFQWNFTPTTTEERNYGIYVWLPGGPTDVSPTGSPVQRRFPQRYFVYEVRYGADRDANGEPDQRLVDVLDTEAVGTGFVRLGASRGSDGATDAVFNTIGTPIRVRLYNTVPRNSDGSLRIDGSSVQPDTPAGNQADANLAATRLVYADAVQARPQAGSYVASPITGTVTGGTTTGLSATADYRVIAARNNYVDTSSGGTFRQTTAGTVYAYQGNPSRWLDSQNPLVTWSRSFVAESSNGNTIDNDAAGTSFTGDFVRASNNPRHIGDDYRLGTAVFGAPTATAAYRPTLDDGTYDVYAYVPGNSTAPVEQYAHAVQYIVYEGNNIAFTGTIDQSTPRGWVRLGTRRYLNDTATGLPLRVEITNRSRLAGDAGLRVYADAVRFVSATELGIASTPVHATVTIRKSNGAEEATKVVLVADESGRIHCLDLAGRGDGTTIEYWSYPSTPNYNDINWRDPNLADIVAGTGATASGIDGVINPAVSPARDNAPTATMPTSFDLSTAAVARVNGVDLLYIGATNGRVYCIEMKGRGDYNANTNVIGTTRRSWTYPNDYDPTNPGDPIGASDLGAFRGSVVFGDTAQGAPGPTVFVPARSGRIVALDANPGDARRQTKERWLFPRADQPTLPPISMTPTLYKAPPPADTPGTLFFGTLRDPNDDGPGRFYAVDATKGTVIWRVNGPSPVSATDVPGDTGATIRYAENDAGNFVAGPVAVSGQTLDGNVASTRPDAIYAINDNLSLYARRADNGALIYRTAPADLRTLCDTNLTFTFASVFGRGGATRSGYPVIVVPGTNGEITFSFARVEDYNDGSGNGVFAYRADGRFVRGGEVRSVASSNNFLYAADNEGALYAYDALGADGLNIPVSVDTGSTNDIPPNDPAGRPFRHLKIKLISKTKYLALREVDENGASALTYDQAVNGADAGAPTNPYAFEWGESAYVLVFGFPYVTENRSGDSVPVSQVTVTLSMEGRVTPPKTVDARKFKEPPLAPAVDEPNPDLDDRYNRQNGYAVVSFAFQNAGSTALPPGNGQITASISTAALGTGTGTAPIRIDPVLRDPQSVVDFTMANPLYLEVFGLPTDNATFGYGEGSLYSPEHVANAVNGSPELGEYPGNRYPGAIESQIMASAGMGNHGSTATARFRLWDRSLMVLQRPEGITNVRLNRTNLQRQGGLAGIFNPLSTTLYPGFEDAPTRFPNNSLDYPDIGREQVRAVKDPAGNPENPLLTTVSLKGPVSSRPETRNQPLTEEDLDYDPSVRNARQALPTEFDLPIDIPRYQPPVNTSAPGMRPGTGADNPSDLLHLRHNATGNVLPQGYFGRVQVYIDSTGDGKLTAEGTREVFRSFNYAVGVAPQTAIQVGTPTVDLGSLASGTGYATGNPSDMEGLGGNGSVRKFNPWFGEWAGAYRPISVRNDGNINLLDLRLAKGTNSTKGEVPNQANNSIWRINAADNDPLAWMSAITLDTGGAPRAGDLWGNFDSTFAPTNRNPGGGNRVILQKPRVTDRVPTELVVNPYPRANPNLLINGRPVDGSIDNRINKDAGMLPSAPKVGVSVPLGFPVGNYESLIRVVENNAGASLFDQILDLNLNINQYEAYSDPITLTYKVRETRMTNRATPRVAPVIDIPAAQSFRNAAPAAMRDAIGNLIVAFESDRDTKAGNNGAVNSTYLYLSTLNTNASFGADGLNAPAGNSPLYDLSLFAPASGAQWFKPYGGGAYPSDADVPGMFPGGSVVPSTRRFASPSFPIRGAQNPLAPLGSGAKVGFGDAYMGFIGEAQVQTATGRLSQSRVFLATVRNQSGALVVGKPIPVGGDPQTAKGKPSVLQLATGPLVFFSETAAGQSGITVSRMRSDGTFKNPDGTLTTVGLNFGDGFSSVFSPSASARPYVGANPTGDITPQIVDLTFAGKLRGRPNAEAYLGRLRLAGIPGDDSLQLVDGTGPNRRSIESGRSGSPFLSMPQQTKERLVNDGNGVYRARGVVWSRQPQAAPDLVQVLNGVPTSVLIGSPTVERQSGLMVYDSALGGKVYLDPELGTVKFVGTAPNRNAELRLTYTPTFLRVTPGGGAAYSAVNGLWDDRYVSEYGEAADGSVYYPYWQKGNGNAVQAVGPTDEVRNDRYFFAYGRGAAGGGVTARPYSTTMRLGVRLPTRIATDENGNVLSVRVAGTDLHAYQVDPANGRIYFQAEDEGKAVVVTYTGVNEATNAPVAGIQVPTPTAGQPTPPLIVSFVLEREEAPIPVDEAANDSALTAFLDPFTYPSKAKERHERPPLVWLFYTSTRAGFPDLYFQSIAPRFLPFAK